MRPYYRVDIMKRMRGIWLLGDVDDVAVLELVGDADAFAFVG